MVTEPQKTKGGTPVQRQPESGWFDLSPFEQAKAWERQSPESAAVVRKLAIRHFHHQLALQWADRLTALGMGVALVILGWHYADVGAPMSGLFVFGSGAVASAAAAVGVRWVSSRRRR